ncbi:MAG: hypothetical protein DME42_08065 [Verrucomicrobia bacterium]|nr:MAG: hypothetical protein DME42_08065 [Verrucomicrobiota bacterium]
MLVSASRRNSLSFSGKSPTIDTQGKVRDCETQSPTRETRALPGKMFDQVFASSGLQNLQCRIKLPPRVTPTDLRKFFAQRP